MENASVCNKANFPLLENHKARLSPFHKRAIENESAQPRSHGSFSRMKVSRSDGCVFFGTGTLGELQQHVLLLPGFAVPLFEQEVVVNNTKLIGKTCGTDFFPPLATPLPRFVRCSWEELGEGDSGI